MNGGITLKKETAKTLLEMISDFNRQGRDESNIPSPPRVGVPQFAYLKIISERLDSGDTGDIKNKKYYHAKVMSVDTSHNYSENFTDPDNYVLVYPIDQDDEGTIPEGTILLGYRGGYDTETVTATSHGSKIHRPWFIPVTQCSEIEVVECLDFSLRQTTFVPQGESGSVTGFVFDTRPMMKKRKILVLAQGPEQISCQEIQNDCGCIGGPNQPPQVTLSVSVSGSTATFTGVVTDDGPVAVLQVLVQVTGQDSVGGTTDNSGNYITSGTYPAGKHKARATAWDINGNSGSSEWVEFTIAGDGSGNNDGYSLTVIGGTQTPTGNHAAGAVVNISATIPSGQTFLNWTTPSGGSFGNANSANTTYTMPVPGSDATVTANFTGGGGGGGPTTYMITFINATGNPGPHAAGAIVTITANVPPMNTFTNFTSTNGGTFANAAQSPTNFTMPASNTTIIGNSILGGGGGGTKPIIMPFILNKAPGQISYSGQVIDDVSNANMVVTITVNYTGVAGAFMNSFNVVTNGTGGFSGVIPYAFIPPNPNPQPLPAGTYRFSAVAGPDSQTQFSDPVAAVIMYP